MYVIILIIIMHVNVSLVCFYIILQWSPRNVTFLYPAKSAASPPTSLRGNPFQLDPPSALLQQVISPGTKADSPGAWEALNPACMEEGLWLPLIMNGSKMTCLLYRHPNSTQFSGVYVPAPPLGTCAYLVYPCDSSPCSHLLP